MTMITTSIHLVIVFVFVFVVYWYFCSYDALRQKYYAFLGIKNRKQSYDPTSVWTTEKGMDEKSEIEADEVLLWKVGPMMGRSGSAIVSLFPYDMAKYGLLAYLYFRIQDTWADLVLTEDKALRTSQIIEGLGKLPKRLSALYNHRYGISDANSSYHGSKPSSTGKLAPEDISNDIKWDLGEEGGRSRNRLYVDILKNSERFDSVYYNLANKTHQEVLLIFATEMAEGWQELERIQYSQQNNLKAGVASSVDYKDFMRLHAHVALDIGFFAFCKANDMDELEELIRPKNYDVCRSSAKESEEKKLKDLSAGEDGKVRKAFVEASDFIWYLNCAATIEEDLEEGLYFDEELYQMMVKKNANSKDDDFLNKKKKGSLLFTKTELEIIESVRARWLLFAMERYLKSADFILHPIIKQNWSARMLILQFLRVSLQVSEKYLSPNPKEVSGAVEIVKTLYQGWTPAGFEKGVLDTIKRAELLLEGHQK